MIVHGVPLPYQRRTGRSVVREIDEDALTENWTLVGNELVQSPGGAVRRNVGSPRRTGSVRYMAGSRPAAARSLTRYG
jgi:hypothetical protein